MRWKSREPEKFRWYRRFAWLPIRVWDDEENEIWVWLEWLEWQKLGEGSYVGSLRADELYRLPGGYTPPIGSW